MTDNSGWWISLLGAVATVTVVPLIIAVNILLGGGGPGVELHHSEFTTEGARKIGAQLGIDWRQVDLEQFRMGLGVELEHGLQDPETNITNDDPLMTGKIAWAHLNEFPDYYTRLKKVEDNWWWARIKAMHMNPGKMTPAQLEDLIAGISHEMTSTEREDAKRYFKNITVNELLRVNSDPPRKGNPDHEAKIDARFEPYRERKKAAWKAKGYPDGIIDKALTWAEEYSIGMASKITTDPELHRRIELELYPKALDMSDHWIEGLLEFLK